MPTLNALDYSDGRPEMAAMKSAGIKAVCRYLTGAGKALSAGEAADLHGNGFGILLNFEIGAGDALLGASKGKSNGAAARDAVDALGVPAGIPIYYSVDRDITTQMPTVMAYLKAADAPQRQARCYGEYDVVNAWGRPAWQTIAWSHSEISPLAVIYQYEINQTLGCAAVDHNEIRDINQLGAWWPTSAITPTPATPSEEDDMEAYILFDQASPNRAALFEPNRIRIIKDNSEVVAYKAMFGANRCRAVSTAAFNSRTGTKS